jgi:recombinational DNA repair protein RecR
VQQPTDPVLTLVVEEALDVLLLNHRGITAYHVLQDVLSPIEGIDLMI